MHDTDRSSDMQPAGLQPNALRGILLMAVNMALVLVVYRLMDGQVTSLLQALPFAGAVSVGSLMIAARADRRRCRRRAFRRPRGHRNADPGANLAGRLGQRTAPVARGLCPSRNVHVAAIRAGCRPAVPKRAASAPAVRCDRPRIVNTGSVVVPGDDCTCGVQAFRPDRVRPAYSSS